MAVGAKCTASGQQRTWSREAWAADEEVMCPDCGAVGAFVWVRGSDLSPLAKTRAHKAPAGVIPSPYAVLPNGGVLARTVVR